MPTYQVNMTNVQESKGGGGPKCPPGLYLFQVVDYKTKTTKNKDPMILAEFHVVRDINGSEVCCGARVYDNITIPNVGSPAFSIMGLTKHFLHCIGEPYEGEINIDPDAWIGRQFWAKIFHEPYTKPGALEPTMFPKVQEYLLEEDLPVQTASNIDWNE